MTPTFGTNILTPQQLYRRGWTEHLIQKIIGLDPVAGASVTLDDVLLLETTPELRRRFRVLT